MSAHGAAVVAGTTASLSWVPYIGTAACVCSNSTGLCRLFAHLVLLATPNNSDVTQAFMGGADFSLDGGAAQSGHGLVFEGHTVSGVCDGDNCNITGPSLMYNWGYEAFIPMPATGLPETPTSMCVQAWLRNSVPMAPVSRSDQKCVPFSKPTIAPPAANEVILAYNNFSSAATRQCGDVLCRTNLHIVFTATPPDATHELQPSGEYSLDGGASWLIAGSNAFYEQHIDKGSDGGYSQALQFDVDLLLSKADNPENICYRIFVVDTATSTSSETMSGCLTVCNQLVPFHNPAGYCPGSK